MKNNLKERKFFIAVQEMISLVAIISFHIALFYPAINEARLNDGLPPIGPDFTTIIPHSPILNLILFPLTTTLSFAEILKLLQLVLPIKVRSYFRWKPIPKEKRPKIVPVEDSRPAFISLSFAILCSALLIFCATHFRVDRTHRRPIVTYEGIAAEYVDFLINIGIFSSFIVLISGGFCLAYFKCRWKIVNDLSFFLASLNLFGSFMFACAVFED
jgi:hypothetical protein